MRASGNVLPPLLASSLTSLTILATKPGSFVLFTFTILVIVIITTITTIFIFLLPVSVKMSTTFTTAEPVSLHFLTLTVICVYRHSKWGNGENATDFHFPLLSLFGKLVDGRSCYY